MESLQMKQRHVKGKNTAKNGRPTAVYEEMLSICNTAPDFKAVTTDEPHISFPKSGNKDVSTKEQPSEEKPSTSNTASSYRDSSTKEQPAEENPSTSNITSIYRDSSTKEQLYEEVSSTSNATSRYSDVSTKEQSSEENPSTSNTTSSYRDSSTKEQLSEENPSTSNTTSSYSDVSTKGQRSDVVSDKMVIGRLKELQKHLTELKENNRNVLEQIDHLLNTPDLQRQMENVKKDVEAVEITINEALCGRMSSITISKFYHWEVTDFVRKFYDKDHQTLTSPPFYVRDFGYKMGLKVYPNGNGAGYNTHFSVYFALLKGKYDPLLEWPFREKVTVTLIGQRRNHVETFSSKSKIEGYQKPKSDCNVAVGNPRFIVLNKLMESDEYFINGSIILRLRVDG